MEFAQKVVLITGAGAGIGAATAVEFAKLSASLVLVDRNRVYLKNITKICEKHNVKVLPIIADLTKEKDVETIVQQTIEKCSRLDVLVNNAGFGNQGGVLDGLVPYDSIMAINIRSVYQLTGLAAPHLITTKGCIINVSSVASESPVANAIPYRMSKAALDMFTKCVALELAPHVRVNSVNPGPTRTQFLESAGMTEQQAQKVFEIMSDAVPLQRVSDANEMADMIVYLAADKARGMTGSIVAINNGYLLVGPNFTKKEK